MLLLGLDLETGGKFNPGPTDTNFITELGLVLWDTEFNSPVDFYSKILNLGHKVSPESEQVSGISQSLLEKHGVPVSPDIIKDVLKLILKADYIVAHNGSNYDKPVMSDFFKSNGTYLPSKVWIDTVTDIDYPPQCKNTNLTYLQAFHGFVNPFPHRAISDVLTMMTILSKYDINKVIENACSDTHILRALVSYDQKDLAKEKKFSWEMAGTRRIPKSWVKLVKANKVEQFINQCNFQVELVDIISAT